MLSKIIETLPQGWLLDRSDGFAKWLYATESALGLLLTVSAWEEFGPLGLAALLYPAWQITKYYDLQRRREIGRRDPWSPSTFAVACASVFFVLGAVTMAPLSIFLSFGVDQTLLKLLVVAAGPALVYHNVMALRKLRKSEWLDEAVF